jgi:hypothetical protein
MRQMIKSPAKPGRSTLIGREDDLEPDAGKGGYPSYRAVTGKACRSGRMEAFLASRGAGPRVIR